LFGPKKKKKGEVTGIGQNYKWRGCKLCCSVNIITIVQLRERDRERERGKSQSSICNLNHLWLIFRRCPIIILAWKLRFSLVKLV
jgi:hypothetical protein